MENDPDCACPTLPLLKRNRTSCRLQLRVGLIDTIDNVFCPATAGDPVHSAQRPWLRIQSRESNAVDFNRTWHEYRRGFGHVQSRTDFWIGNENLHWLTTTYSCRLKIELTDWYNETRTAIYEMFSVASQNDGYRIRIGEYHGDMEPSNKVDSRHLETATCCFSSYEPTRLLRQVSPIGITTRVSRPTITSRRARTVPDRTAAAAGGTIPVPTAHACNSTAA